MQRSIWMALQFRSLPSLGHFRHIGERAALNVEPAAIAEAAGLDDQRVAIPSPD